MQETQVWPLGLEDPLEEGMATHPSILAWRIPWREEPGGYSPWGHKRVGQDWATNSFSFTACLLSPFILRPIEGVRFYSFLHLRLLRLRNLKALAYGAQVVWSCKLLDSDFSKLSHCVILPRNNFCLSLENVKSLCIAWGLTHGRKIL